MPDFSLEARYDGPVAGVDEVGRGPMAGPVVACAVILSPGRMEPSLVAALRDSKALTARRREGLSALLRESPGVAFSLGQAEVGEIDTLNILQATFLAMRRALAGLDPAPAAVLVDGPHKIRGYEGVCEPVVRGDSRSASIAAASILAKVERDALMADLARQCPGYGWERNAGYGTADHREALARLGPTEHHRRSFRPVREELERRGLLPPSPSPSP
ncbi:ribonuclease HII [Phaeovibrio sulfidiphilus]|uniref:Ribonuclease HII n=1 Tax=Phaeovibrio sulfidiphilus TaxID=1220600 RepID=A0A8J7CBM4_9PROT|nr:ribonuclease HII [Phaeovibrio sulfidiphilus]MBE1236333.1 ribonuclease HII [Phaeovibrio sulfidiphilus]